MTTHQPKRTHEILGLAFGLLFLVLALYMVGSMRSQVREDCVKDGGTWRKRSHGGKCEYKLLESP